MNCTNKYVPDFVPSDLKWYQRDGFMTWYDQVKCETFLEDVNKQFTHTKIVNFEIINKWVKGEEISEGTFRNYHTVQKRVVFDYPIHEREKIMSATLKSPVKRNDVFVSKELVNDRLTSPLNDNNMFFSSMKKRFNKKKAKIFFSKIVFEYGKVYYRERYFVKNYSFIELFCGIWANYVFLKGNGTNKCQKKSFNYYICCYQEACYKKWEARFPDFLF